MTDERAPAPHSLRVQRTARYYTLGDTGGDVRDVWLVVHGYGQLAGEFIRYFTDLVSPGVRIVAPEAMNRFYLVSPEKAPARDRPVGATWMTREDRAGEIADYVEYLDAVYDDVVRPAVDAGARVHVLGFSQGTATASRWVEHGRAHVDRLILWGGLLPPETDLTRGAAVFRGARLTYVLGSRDHYVDDAALAAEGSRLDAAAVPHDVIRFDGGHVISRGVFAQLRDDAPAAPDPIGDGAR